MTEERKKILEKAAKLKTLAERGYKGEKDNAERMYKMYVEKNKITESEIKSLKFTRENKFYDMTAAEFFKHIEIDLQMFAYSMLIFGIGRFMRNESVERAGIELLKNAVKMKDETNNQNNENNDGQKENKPEFKNPNIKD